MIKIIVFLAEALAKSFSKMIKRLDIRYEPKERIFIGDLYLSDQDKPDFEIREDGTVVKYFRDAVIPTGIVFDTDDPSPDTEQTAANAMENMKAAVDDLKIPFKPKEGPEPEVGGALDPVQEKERKNKSKIDTGKIKALKNAGWSVEKIADEMKLGVSTVYAQIRKLKEAGLVK
ncbi:MAG: ArsR family transcriptional regulator [Lachnospiraceae bacterium]|jgi:DNA-binding transcriptional ArsR family regulator|nr:ArsR family transcriptional regulator [Lachnospiraceae bacterium]